MASSLLRFTAAAGIFRIAGGRRMITTAAAAAASSISPWLMLQPASDGYKFYSLALNKVVTLTQPPPPSTEGGLNLVGSSHGWLALFNPDNHHLFLTNPISGRRIKLPELRTLPGFDEYPRSGLSVDKIILTSSPSGDCFAVMRSPFGSVRMSYCLPTADGAASWSPLCVRSELGPDDFAFSSRHRRLFAINCAGEVESLDFADHGTSSGPHELDHWPNTVHISYGVAVPMWGRRRRYLVPSDWSDRLFAVTRHVVDRAAGEAEAARFGLDDGCPYRTVRFDVHELDWERRTARRCVDDGLDGLAMFVGTNHSFAVPAAEFPGLKADSIYFTDDNPTRFRSCDVYGGHDMGVYSFADRSFSSVYYPCRRPDSDAARADGTVASWFSPTLE